MEPAAELSKQLEADHRRQTRQMTPEQKFMAGGDLFDEACRWTLAGIREQYPRFSDAEARDELRRRLLAARVRERR